VAKYLVLWRRSPATWPTDPEEKSKIIQKIGTTIVDDNIKKGNIKEHGHFLDGNSGYTIWEVDATELFKNSCMTWPYYEYEVHEIIPYEKSGKILRETVLKIPTEATKK
jgi:hypothetical protein